MREVFKFIVTTTRSGLVFVLPLLIVGYIVIKAFSYFLGWLSELLVWLGSALGLNDSGIWIGVFIGCLLVFVGGLLLRVGKLTRVVSRLEDKLLSLIPGYRFVKSIARDQNLSEDIHMKPAVYRNETGWHPCFQVESKNRYTTIFVPEAPNVNAGSIIIVASDTVAFLPITNFQMTLIIRDYGLGAIDLMNAEVEKPSKRPSNN